MKINKQEIILLSSIVFGLGILILTASTSSSILQTNSKETVRENIKDFEFKADLKKVIKNKVLKDEVPKDMQMKERLKLVALKFEQTLKYPPYSQPLSKKRKDLLEPNKFYPTRLMLNDTVSTSISLSKYQYFKPEKIDIKLLVQAPTDIESYSLEELVILNKNEIVAHLNFVKSQNNDKSIIYTASYSAPLSETKSWSNTLMLRARYKGSLNQKLSATTSFKYVQKEAEMTGVKVSYIDESELIIPVKLDVYSDGKYLIKANLFDKEGNPLIHLYASEFLSKGSGIINLKAHYAALSLKNAAGPYELKNISIIRLITTREGKRAYGESQRPSYTVNGFALDRYNSEPYNNTQGQEKLAFLQKISK